MCECVKDAEARRKLRPKPDENFLQTAGLQDGASHCAKILSAMYSALNSDPSDPDVIIKLDISNAFNVLCHRLTLDVLGGKASCYYACGLKEGCEGVNPQRAEFVLGL